MRPPEPKDPKESARLAIEYLAAGLSELEITVNRVEQLGKPRPIAIDDAAGNVAQALAWARHWVGED